MLPPPRISILSPENTTYAVDNVTLAFTINKPTTWIACSLDGQKQITIDENITLADLSEGFHNITLYAKDEFQALGISQTIHFIDFPDPPDPAPVIPMTVAVAVTAVILSVVACLLICFKKTYASKSLLNTP